VSQYQSGYPFPFRAADTGGFAGRGAAGLHLPLVYNTSGYDSLDTLRMLDGIIDIYLPDIRYAASKWGKEYSGVPDYVERDREAIKEMFRHVGNLVTDDDGSPGVA